MYEPGQSGFPPVAVSVYVVVVAGVATGLAMFGLDNPVVGDQEYVVPPEAFKVVDCPAQMLTSLPASAVKTPD